MTKKKMMTKSMTMKMSSTRTTRATHGWATVAVVDHVREPPSRATDTPRSPPNKAPNSCHPALSAPTTAAATPPAASLSRRMSGTSGDAWPVGCSIASSAPAIPVAPEPSILSLPRA